MGVYKACGLFSPGHFVLLILTILAIAVLLYFSKNKAVLKVKGIIKRVVITAWMLEAFKIGYKLYCGDLRFLESYMPLFYCSIFLYAGLLSAFGKGNLQRAGDVVLITGSLVGGVVFLIFPTTSLPDYPALHFVSIHSFLYHGAMVYVGMLMIIKKYIKLRKNDIWLNALVTGALCVVSLVINVIFDCNLMFISKGFPGRLGAFLFDKTGNLYTPLAVVVHLFLPYYIVYGIIKKISAVS